MEVDSKFDSLICSLILGVAVLLLYLFLCYKRKAIPDLGRGITIFVSSFGLVAAASLGWLTIWAQSAELGILHNQKGPICIGAIAMAWVSVSAACGAIFKQ